MFLTERALELLIPVIGARMKFLKLMKTTDPEVTRAENCNEEAECSGLSGNVLDGSTSGTFMLAFSCNS